MSLLVMLGATVLNQWKHLYNLMELCQDDELSGFGLGDLSYQLVLMEDPTELQI